MVVLNVSVFRPVLITGALLQGSHAKVSQLVGNWRHLGPSTLGTHLPDREASLIKKEYCRLKCVHTLPVTPGCNEATGLSLQQEGMPLSGIGGLLAWGLADPQDPGDGCQLACPPFEVRFQSRWGPHTTVGGKPGSMSSFLRSEAI